MEELVKVKTKLNQDWVDTFTVFEYQNKLLYNYTSYSNGKLITKIGEYNK